MAKGTVEEISLIMKIGISLFIGAMVFTLITVILMVV